MSQTGSVPAQSATAAGQASWDEHVKKTLSTLHTLYNTYVKPLEDRYKYDLFKPTWFEETLLNQKPFVTFFGPWSAGKSTFINHLLQGNYLWTGPQPTTAEFTVVVHGDEAGPLDGRILATAKDLPFKGLNEFGESFLQNFQGFQCPHELLKSVTLIDTPGVLESAKEIHQRKYDYIKLSRWFAERSDLVFVMFDPTKLDAGVELRMMFKHAFKGMESKVRIVLNKADMVNTQELMRVYGSLFWNLSNMISSTEPPRVYCGSFWDQPYKEGTFHLLFSEEKADLIHELLEVIPAQALDKKVASLIKRAREVFIHSVIIGQMRSSLPTLFGKEKAKKKALDELNITYEKVGSKFKMNHRDFPPVEEYRAFLSKFDLEAFAPIEKVDKEGLLSQILNLIDTVLPRMLKPVKATPMADPRNKEQRKDLQQTYHRGMANQVQGVGGIQGSSDVSSTGIRASPMALVQPTSPASQPSPTVKEAAPLPPQPTTPPTTPPATPPPPQQPQAGGDMNAMMQQMMQMMMASGGGANPAMMQQMMAMMAAQQQQQQQPPAPAPAPAPVAPVAPAPTAPPAGGQDPNAMMQMMLAMQQQQQQQQQQQPQAPAPDTGAQSSYETEASAPQME